MIKKTLLASLLFVSTLFGANDAQVINYFKAQIPVPTIEIKVTSRISIEGIKGMDYVSLDISDGERAQKVSVFTQGDLIFPDVISIKGGGSIKQKLDKTKLISELSKLYKEENPENILVLGKDKNKETLIKFSDPECPFCLKEIEKIEEKLKNFNVKIIFTPVHERSSLEKSFLIYEQAKKAANLEDKIAIVKKYFTSDADKEVSDEDVERMENLRKKYFGAGLKGVPFYVTEKELLQ